MQPIDQVIKVDLKIHGCPIPKAEFLEVVKSVLAGRKPQIPDYPVCVECKLKENICLFDKGGFCVGPITRAGCGAVCTSYGVGCEGCRGPISNPNRDSMKTVLAEHGLKTEDILARMTMFNAYEAPKA